MNSPDLKFKNKWGPCLGEKVPIRHSGNRGRRTRQATVIVAGLLNWGLPHPFFPVPSVRNLSAPSFRSPFLELLPVSAESCGICILRAWSGSASSLAAFCFHLSIFPARAFYLLLDASNIQSQIRIKQVLPSSYLHNLYTLVINKLLITNIHLFIRPGKEI